MKLQQQNFTRPKKPNSFKTSKQVQPNKEKKLEKFTFRSFKGQMHRQGFVFFMLPEFDQNLVQQCLYQLFKHQQESPFKQPYIVVIEKDEFIKIREIKPGKLYFIFIAECSETDLLDGFEVDDQFSLKDVHRKRDVYYFISISKLYIIYEQIYNQLFIGPDLPHIHKNIEQIITQHENEKDDLNQMYDQFRLSCQKRREVLREQIDKVKEKQQQVVNFSKFVDWSYVKYIELQEQMTFILKENDIQYLDPVFGNDINQKKQIDLLNANKFSRKFEQTQDQSQKPSFLLNSIQSIQSEENL